jgi:glycerate kinase
MKITNTSIFKDLTSAQAICAAIDEMFNSRASAEFMACLVIDGPVGTCVQHLSVTGRAYTSYFIVSDMGGSFKRVEHCNSMC